MTLVHACGSALLHLVWQGALIAALLWVALLVAPARAARLRYSLACAALIAMLVLPAITVVRALVPAAAAEVAVHAMAAPALAHGGAEAAVAHAARLSIGAVFAVLESHAHEIVLAWALGVLLASLRVLAGWRMVTRVARTAQPAPEQWERALQRLCATLRLRAPVRLLASERVEVPSTVGLLRPIILVPLSVLSGLPERQLELILAHELAHIRRHDYLVNLLQTAAETLLFYHPAIWWIGGVIREERENCCDDLAVATSGSPVAYARALTALEALRAVRAPALSAAGGSLSQRVRRLVMPAARCGGRWSAGASLVTLLAGLLFALPMCAAAMPARTSGSSRFTSHDAPQAEAGAPKARAPQAREGEADDENTGDEEEARDARPQRRVDHDALTARDVIALRTAGVDADTVRAFRDLGIAPTVHNLVELANAGVTREDVQVMRRQFGNDLGVDELVTLKNLGVTPDYVAQLKQAGFHDLTAEQVTSARAVGVTPDYVRELERSGLRVHSLQAATDLRAVGVDAAYVAELERMGLRGLDADRVQSLRAVGVTARWADGLRKAGLTDLSASDLESLRATGVDGAFVRRMKEAGFRELSAQELEDLKANGITPEYLDKLRGR